MVLCFPGSIHKLRAKAFADRPGRAGPIPAFAIWLHCNMFLPSSIQKNDCIPIFLHGKPCSACICVFETIRSLSSMSIKQALLPPRVHVFHRGLSDKTFFFNPDKCYCAHCLRCLIVDDATPKSSDKTISLYFGNANPKSMPYDELYVEIICDFLI